MSLGFFSGAAAQALSEAQLKWQALFEEAERRKLDEKRFTEDLFFRKHQQNEATRIAEAQLRQNEQQNTERFQFQAQSKQIEDIMTSVSSGRLTVVEAYDAFESLRGSLNPRFGFNVDAYQKSLGTHLFLDPRQAADIIKEAHAGQTYIPEPLYREALEVKFRLQGIGADGLEDAMKPWLDDYAARQEAVRKNEEHQTTVNMAELQDLYASTEYRRASTDVAEAQERQIYSDISLNIRDDRRAEEAHGKLMEAQDLTTEISRLDLAARPDLLSLQMQEIRASIGEATARTGNIKVNTELVRRTLDAAVREATANAGMAEENLRHLIATAFFRDAIFAVDYDTAVASLNVLRLQADEIKARTELYPYQVEQLQQEIRVQALDFLAETVYAKPQLFNQLAPELADLLGIEGDARTELLESLSEIAASKVDNEVKRDWATTTIAVTEALYGSNTLEARTNATLAESGYQVRYYREGGIADQDTALNRARIISDIGVNEQNAATAAQNAATARYNASTSRYQAVEGVRQQDEALAQRQAEFRFDRWATTMGLVVQQDQLNLQTRRFEEDAAEAAAKASAPLTDAEAYETLKKSTGMDAETFARLFQNIADATQDSLTPIDPNLVLDYEIADTQSGLEEGTLLARHMASLTEDQRAQVDIAINAMVSWIDRGFALTNGLVIPPGVSPDNALLAEALLRSSYLAFQEAPEGDTSGEDISTRDAAMNAVIGANLETIVGVANIDELDFYGATEAVRNVMSEDERVEVSPLELRGELEPRMERAREAYQYVTAVMVNHFGYDATQVDPNHRDEALKAFTLRIPQLISVAQALPLMQPAETDIMGVTYWSEEQVAQLKQLVDSGQIVVPPNDIPGLEVNRYAPDILMKYVTDEMNFINRFFESDYILRTISR